MVLGMSKEDERERFVVAIEGEAFEQIKQLKEMTGSGSISQVVVDAIRFYSWLHIQEENIMVAAKDPSNKVIQTVDIKLFAKRIADEARSINRVLENTQFVVN